MQSSRFFFIALFLAALGAAGMIWIYYEGEKSDNRGDMETIYLGGRTLEVKIADDNFERQQGLQGVAELGGYDGMLFVFDSGGSVSFWNKNTLLDLDLVWIREGKVTGVSFLPRERERGLVTLASPEGGVEMVLELPAGRAEALGVTVGTSFSLSSRLQ